MTAKRHVMAVYKATDTGMGGIGAYRNVRWNVDETIATWDRDPKTIRLQIVEVTGDGAVTILHDHTYHDRIAAAGSTEAIASEVRRAARLDDHSDQTVHDVLFGDTCINYRACPHRKGRN